MPKQLKQKFEYPWKFEKILSPKSRKMLDQKQIRAFRIHSNMSRHKMPKQLKQKFEYPWKFEKILSPKLEKCQTKNKLGIPPLLKHE